MNALFPVLDTLVTELFDHSGTFPPASRTFEEALTDAAHFSSTLQRPFMLANHLVVPSKTLTELGSMDLLSYGFTSKEPPSFCVLGTPLEEVSASSLLSPSLVSDLCLLKTWDTLPPSDGVPRALTSYEIKLSPSLIAHQVLLRDSSTALLQQLSGLNILLALEPDLSVPQWKEHLETVCLLIKELSEGGRKVALKVRCTGPTGIGVEKLTEVLFQVATHELHFKVTGGLHHPIIEPSKYGNHVGFLNLVIALIFRRSFSTQEFSQEQLREVLVNEEASAFHIEKELKWRQYTLRHERVSEIKNQFHFSIGSCSLLEPDLDLLRLYDNTISTN